MKLTSPMTVLITGASRGIGAAIAKRLAAEQMHLILHYGRSEQAVQNIATTCREQGAQVTLVQADLRLPADIKRMYEQLATSGTLPDVLINNAAIAHYGLLSDVTLAEWDDVFNVNLRSVFLLCQLFTPAMISRKFGRIVNVSSIWGQVGASCESVYAASKGGLDAFTKSLAKELAPSNITVNAVSPGIIDTEMNAGLTHDDCQQIAAEVPLGRLGQPSEVAEVIYYLVHPRNSYMTGQIVNVNGGWSM